MVDRGASVVEQRQRHRDAEHRSDIVGGFEPANARPDGKIGHALRTRQFDAGIRGGEVGIGRRQRERASRRYRAGRTHGAASGAAEYRDIERAGDRAANAARETGARGIGEAARFLGLGFGGQARDFGAFLFERRGAPRLHSYGRGARRVAGDTILVLGNRDTHFGGRGLDIEFGDLEPDIGLRNRLRDLRAVRRRIGNRDPGLPLAAEFERDRDACRDIGAIDAIIGPGADEILDFDRKRWVGAQPRDSAGCACGINVRRCGFRRGRAAARERNRLVERQERS